MKKLAGLLIKLKIVELFKRIESNYKKLVWLNDRSKFKRVGEMSMIVKPYILKNPQYIEIGENFSAMCNFRIEAWDEYSGEKFVPSIIIGDNVIFNTDCHIGCISKVVIGNNVLFASRVFISDHFHGDTSGKYSEVPPALRPLTSKGPVIIEDNVWVGEGVVILPNVRIGRNSIIGANSVVNKDIPENSVIGGVPARILKKI